MQTFLQYGDTGLIILQLTLAVVFIYHGWPKLRQSKHLASGMGIPAEGVLVLGLLEVAGGLGIGLGVAVQASALVLALIMVGSTYFKFKKWNVPFSSNDKTGWEFDVTLLAVLIYLLTNVA